MNFMFIICLISIFFSARGDLISFELINEISKDNAQQLLDSYVSNSPSCPYDLEMYKLEYETINQFNQIDIASGAIVVPKNQLEFYSFAIFHHGTEVRKLSTYSESGNFDILPVWLGSTYVTLLPDYLGLGSSSVFHPYQINLPSATSSVDMIYAAKQFCNIKDIHTNEQIFITGYSEGGYVSAATQKMIEESHSEDLSIAASALCAGAYDMSGTMFDLMVSNEEYGEPYYLPYILFAYQDSYNILDSVSDFFSPEYSDTLIQLFNGHHSGGAINNIMPSIPVEAMNPDLVAAAVNDINHPLRVRLRENDLYDWKPESPTNLIHSYQDELVPYQNSEIAYQKFIENGATDVDLTLVNYGYHQEAAPNILIGSYYWFEQFRQVQLFDLGDINIDLNIDVNDIISLVSIIVNNYDPNGTELILADVNQDSLIDLFDILTIVSLILTD